MNPEDPTGQRTLFPYKKKEEVMSFPKAADVSEADGTNTNHYVFPMQSMECFFFFFFFFPEIPAAHSPKKGHPVFSAYLDH